MVTNYGQRVESDRAIIRKLLDLFAEYGYNYRQARQLLQDAVGWLDEQPVQQISPTVKPRVTDDILRVLRRKGIHSLYGQGNGKEPPPVVDKSNR